MQQKSPLLTYDILRHVARFLTLNQLLSLQIVSKQMKDHIQKILKFILKNLGLDNGNTTTPSNIICRTIFGRETYYWAFDESVKPFKRRHTLGLPVKSFQVGLTFTGILTLQNQLYICKSEEYQETINQKPNFITKNNVKQFSTSGKGRVLYLKTNGDLILMFENLEEYQIANQVEFFETSYFLVVAIFNEPHKVDQLQTPISHAITYSLQDVSIQNCNLGQRYKQITLPENDPITQVAVGGNNIYYLTKSQKIHSSEIKQDQALEQNLKTTHQPYFDKKSIISLHCGLNYFLALGREIIKSIKEWNNEELQNWLNVIGFSDYVNIVKYNEFSGEEFAKNAVNQEFQIHTLGLTNVELQIKLSTEITRSLEFQHKDYQLFGWGKNDFGQLAVPLSNNVNYQKINLPNLDEEDEIVQIECGWKNVAILTHSGKVYLTENLAKQKKEKEVQPIQQDDQNKKRKKSRQDTKDQKEYKDQKEQKEQKEQEPQNKFWSDISKIFVKSNDKREYRHYYVNLCKDYLVVVCSIFDKKLMTNYFPEMLEQKEGHKKFKPTLQIIDRILWDLKYNKNDFVVGYEDRFLGIMEVPFTDFINSQVKSHRVQYFKQFNKIVWDRQRRMDLL